jgi:hypothetical protein
MWRLLLLGAMAGSKRLQALLLAWVALMALFLYVFVHDAFDGSSRMSQRPTSPAASTPR